MGWIIVVYFVIFILELTVGCSFIMWKCIARSEFECKLALSGTILSVAIWILVVLVCPCFMSPCEVCDLFDKMIEKCSHCYGKLQTTKHHELYIYNEVYCQTTESLLSNDQDNTIPDSINNLDPLLRSSSKQRIELEQLCKNSEIYESKEENISYMDKEQQKTENIITEIVL